MAGFRIAGTADCAVLGFRLLLTAGLVVIFIVAPGVGDFLQRYRKFFFADTADIGCRTLFRAGGLHTFFGQFFALGVAECFQGLCKFLFAHLADISSRTSLCAGGLYPLLRYFLTLGVGKHISVILFCGFGAVVMNDRNPGPTDFKLIPAFALINRIALFRTSRQNRILFNCILMCVACFCGIFVHRPILVGPGGFPVLGQLRQGSGLVLLCHFPVLGQFRQSSGLVLLCHLPVLRQFRQCSSFVSLGIDVGLVNLRVGFLLLGLGCRGLHLVGVRRQYGSRRGQGKTNGQHQSGRTSAQFVNFSHVPSSFNCCRVSGFACRP